MNKKISMEIDIDKILDELDGQGHRYVPELENNGIT